MSDTTRGASIARDRNLIWAATHEGVYCVSAHSWVSVPHVNVGWGG